jgi:nitroreductase
MDFFDVVKQRGSYRDEFLPVEVPDEDLKAILDAGVRAPSGYNGQTVSFIAVRDAKLRQQIAELLPTPATKTAPVILVVASEPNDHGSMNFEMVDYGAATENLMLAITACGCAGVWMDGMVRSGDMSAKLAKLLHVSEGKTIRTIVPFGKPAKPVSQKEKKPLSERVEIL